MDVIINDHSLCGHFATIDAFENNLVADIIPMLKHFTKVSCVVYKSSETFNRFITAEHRLCDLLRIKGNAQMQRAKSALSNLMFGEPYWSVDDKIEQDETIAPLCIHETYKRNGLLLSFTHCDFATDVVTLVIREKEQYIKNCFSKLNCLTHLYEVAKINESYYYAQINPGIAVNFLVVGDRNYPQEAFDGNNLSSYDKVRIKEKLLNLLSGIVNKTSVGTLCKNFGDGLWEFRVDVSDTRIFRLFYILNSGGITFLNGFIKKSQETPATELSQAKKLVKLTYTH